MGCPARLIQKTVIANKTIWKLFKKPHSRLAFQKRLFPARALLVQHQGQSLAVLQIVGPCDGRSKTVQTTASDLNFQSLAKRNASHKHKSDMRHRLLLSRCQSLSTARRHIWTASLATSCFSCSVLSASLLCQIRSRNLPRVCLRRSLELLGLEAPLANAGVLQPVLGFLWATSRCRS